VGEVKAKEAAVGEVYCVRPDGGSYGRGDGADWDNALPGLPEAKSERWGEGPKRIGAGDTVLVAGGEYRKAWSPGAGGTGEASRLVIRRATKADHGPAAGWQETMDAEVRLVGPAHIRLEGLSYVTVDGVTEYGFYTASEQPRGVVVTKCRQVLVSHVRVDGSVNQDSYRGMDLRDGEEVRISDCWISNTPNDSLLMLNMKKTVIEHCRLGPKIAPAPGKYGWHADLIEARGNTEIDFRYNRVDWAADGVFLFEENKVWRIYGNVFTGGGKATRTHSTNPPVGPVSVHHNVFYKSYAGVAYGSGATGQVSNNIFYQCQSVSYSAATHDHNYYFECGANVEEAGKASGGDPFVDAAKGDFRLKAGAGAVDAGTALAAPFDVDAAGVKRPQGKGWDMGAYELVPAGEKKE
jgi:hypothetical protein